jgi:hypothetical protein
VISQATNAGELLETIMIVVYKRFAKGAMKDARKKKPCLSSSSIETTKDRLMIEIEEQKISESSKNLKKTSNR